MHQLCLCLRRFHFVTLFFLHVIIITLPGSFAGLLYSFSRAWPIWTPLRFRSVRCTTKSPLLKASCKFGKLFFSFMESSNYNRKEQQQWIWIKAKISDKALLTVDKWTSNQWLNDRVKLMTTSNITGQKVKLSIKDFFKKCDQIRKKMRIWSHLLKKSLMGNFINCAVYIIYKCIPVSPKLIIFTFIVILYQKLFIFFNKLLYNDPRFFT